MTRFGRRLVRAGNDRGAKRPRTRIWAAFSGETAQYFRKYRQVFEEWLIEVLEAEVARRTSPSDRFDYPFGFPDWDRQAR